jgi:hypothetical protein
MYLNFYCHIWIKAHRKLDSSILRYAFNLRSLKVLRKPGNISKLKSKDLRTVRGREMIKKKNVSSVFKQTPFPKTKAL